MGTILGNLTVHNRKSYFMHILLCHIYFFCFSRLVSIDLFTCTPLESVTRQNALITSHHNLRQASS